MYPISPMRPKAVQQAVLLPSTRRLALKSTLARNAPIHLNRGWVILTGTTFCGSHQGFKPIFKLIISLIYRSATFLLLRLSLLDPYITGAGQTGAAELLPRQNPRVLECRGTCNSFMPTTPGLHWIALSQDAPMTEQRPAQYSPG